MAVLCREANRDVRILDEVAEGFGQVPREVLEVAEQNVRHPRSLQVLPEAFDEVQFWAVVRKPEYLDGVFDKLEVVMQGLGMVRVALVHHQHNASTGSFGPAHELGQEHPEAPGGLARLGVMVEQPPSVAPGPEDGLFAVPSRGFHSLLTAARHPGPGQVRVKVELGLVLIPQFVVGVGLQSPFLSRSRARRALRKARSLRLPLSVCLGRR
jgi:hypothetical protein